MSTIVDNLTLALISLKEQLEDYLDTNGWQRKYTCYLSGDPELQTKVIVWKNPKRDEVALPLLLIDTGVVQTVEYELGNNQGKDQITLIISISARDNNQLRTLSNAVRRKLNDWVFDIYDYKTKKTNVGSGQLTKSFLTDISDLNSNDISERYNAVINTTLEINVASFV